MYVSPVAPTIVASSSPSIRIQRYRAPIDSSNPSTSVMPEILAVSVRPNFAVPEMTGEPDVEFGSSTAATSTVTVYPSLSEMPSLTLKTKLV